MSRSSLSASQRAFVWLWRRFSMQFVGFADPFVAERVRMEGVRGFLRGARSSFTLLDRLEKQFGVVEAQFVIAFAAMWIGCRWCSVGHALSANLEFFKREGGLAPLDEQEIPELQTMRDPELLEWLLRRFSGPRWEAFRSVIERQYLLKSGQVEEETLEDELLQAANLLWEWVVECSIMAMDMDPTTIPAQSPLGKDRKLVARYYETRKRTTLDNEPADQES